MIARRAVFSSPECCATGGCVLHASRRATLLAVPRLQRNGGRLVHTARAADDGRAALVGPRRDQAGPVALTLGTRVADRTAPGAPTALSKWAQLLAIFLHQSDHAQYTTKADDPITEAAIVPAPTPSLTTASARKPAVPKPVQGLSGGSSRHSGWRADDLLVAMPVFIQITGRVSSVLVVATDCLRRPCSVTVAVFVQVARSVAYVIMMFTWRFTLPGLVAMAMLVNIPRYMSKMIVMIARLLSRHDLSPSSKMTAHPDWKRATRSPVPRSASRNRYTAELWRESRKPERPPRLTWRAHRTPAPPRQQSR